MLNSVREKYESHEVFTNFVLVILLSYAQVAFIYFKVIPLFHTFMLKQFLRYFLSNIIVELNCSFKEK